MGLALALALATVDGAASVMMMIRVVPLWDAETHRLFLIWDATRKNRMVAGGYLYWYLYLHWLDFVWPSSFW